MLRTALLAFAATALLTTSLTADTYDRVVTVVNETSVDIREFYASNKDQSSWQEDILGQDVLSAGYQVDVNIDDGTGYCIYDVRAVFTDGTEVVDKVNVCETGTWRVHE
ncbi:MAG: hypothetical protein ABI459_02340 [Deltaproteobacteria bacterium]